MRMQSFRMRNSLMLLPIAVLLIGSAVYAQIRQHAAHEHGRGTINVVIEGRIIAIELSGPMANFVGFEHEPSNDEQKRQVVSARERLERPQGFLRFDARADCLLRSAVATLPGSESHAENDRHGHEHDDADGADDHDEHLEVTASYEFECTNPGRLAALSVELFSQFPSIEAIEASVLGPSGVTSQELTPQSNEIGLRGP